MVVLLKMMKEVMKKMGKFKIFEDKRGEWRFNLVANNGKVIATSEGYKLKTGAEKGTDSVIKNIEKFMEIVYE